MSKPKTAIEPIRSENYPEWYQQVVKAADLAESSPVRGCMVIKPWGYAIWENIQRDFHSGAQDFVTFGANEPALAYFHRSIKKTLGIDAA